MGVSWGRDGAAVMPSDVDGGDGEKLTGGPAAVAIGDTLAPVGDAPIGEDALEELMFTSKLPSLTSTLIIPLRSCGSGEVGAEPAPRDLMANRYCSQKKDCTILYRYCNVL